MTIELLGQLPSLNDYIAKINRNKYAGNSFKKQIQEDIYWQLKAQKISKIKTPCQMHFHWVEKSKRRDIDNIYSAKKFILDALIEYGAIEGDGQKYIYGITDSLEIAKEDKVILTIEE